MTTAHEPKTLPTEIERLYSVGRLTGGLLHEINNPLNAILMNAELAQMLLSNDGENHKVREALDTIAKEVRRAGTLTKRISTFVRAPDYKPSEQATLKDSVDLCQRLLSSLLRSANVRLQIVADDHFPVCTLNVVALAQAIANVVIAVLEQSAKDIELSMRLQGDRQQIQVAYRPADADADVAAGAEPIPGLALARTIVAEHRGVFEHLDEVTGGDGRSAYIIELPL